MQKKDDFYSGMLLGIDTCLNFMSALVKATAETKDTQIIKGCIGMTSDTMIFLSKYVEKKQNNSVETQIER
jgi:NaMN:DMB phosphoribosyltransferase